MQFSNNGRDRGEQRQLQNRGTSGPVSEIPTCPARLAASCYSIPFSDVGEPWSTQRPGRPASQPDRAEIQPGGGHPAERGPPFEQHISISQYVQGAGCHGLLAVPGHSPVCVAGLCAWGTPIVGCHTRGMSVFYKFVLVFIGFRPENHARRHDPAVDPTRRHPSHGARNGALGGCGTGQFQMYHNVFLVI